MSRNAIFIVLAVLLAWPATAAADPASAHYYRGVSHLASDSPSKNVKGNIQPNYLKEPKLSIAMSDLQTAKELVDTKRLDLVKSIELALLETMFKSEEEDNIAIQTYAVSN